MCMHGFNCLFATVSILYAKIPNSMSIEIELIRFFLFFFLEQLSWRE